MRILKQIVPIVLLMMFSLSASLVSAQNKRGPSTKEERDMAVQYTRALENDPFNDKAKDQRRWLIIFLAEVPDISVKLCGGYFGPLLDKDKNKNYASELVAQMTFGMGVFIIENPDKAKDDEAVYKGGVESMLKTYESILKVKPKAKWSFLDDLIQKRNSGTLDTWVSETTKKCNQPSK